MRHLAWMSILATTGCSLLFPGDEDTTDGAVPTVTPPPPSDLDADGFTVLAGDCDDVDPTVFPGATELCDGIDQDCNGIVDDAPEDGTTYFRDDDGDGFGDDASTLVACARPDGYALGGGDCDDTDENVNPEADDAPGEDRNCDGVPGEAGGRGDIVSLSVTCSPDESEVTFEVMADGPVPDGVIYMADLANYPSIGFEHDLVPDSPDKNGEDRVLARTIDAGVDFGSIARNLTTIFRCDAHFDNPGIMTYQVATLDDGGKVIDCIAQGYRPADFAAGNLVADLGDPPQIDPTACRVVP